MKNLFVMALVSALCAGFVACNEPKDPELQGEDVPFTEYSLAREGSPGEEISVTWTNLDYEYDNSSVLVIDDDTELKKYVEGDYPTIDFSNKTLVLAYGYHSGGGFGDDVKFRQMSDRNYVMTASGVSSAASAFFRWHIAIVVNKLPLDSQVTFNGVILNMP